MESKEKKLNDLLELRKLYQKSSNGIKEVEVLEEIVNLVKEIYGDKSNKYIYYLNELGGSSKYVGKYEQGLKALNEAKNIIKDIYGIRSVQYATCLLNMIEVYRFMGSFEKLEDLYLEVISIYDENNMEKEYVYAGVCNNIGLFYQNTGNLLKSIPYHEKSLEILKNMKEHSVELATTYNNLVIPYKDNDFEKAKEYLEKALKIYEEKLGKSHAMYSAALNNLAILKFEEKDYQACLNIYEDVLKIVKESFGENSLNYQNIYSNVEYIKSLVKPSEVIIEIDENSKLIDKSREYTKKYIIPLFKEKAEYILDKIVIAFCGDGSEVLGYDDEYSKDHDYTFMPAIFLEEQDYIKYGDKLKEILLSLPKEFLGVKHIENDVIAERRGIINFNEYLYRYIGSEDGNLTIQDYRNIPETALCALTSGEIFYRSNKNIEDVFEKLKYYPDMIRENKIATCCTQIAQSGQYNYLRLRKRGDKIAANQAQSIFIENVIHLVYLLNRKYSPFYKWYARGLKDLEILGKNIYDRIEDIISNKDDDMYKISNKMEEICYFLVEELKRQKLSNVKGYFMLNHGIYIQQNIDDENLKNWTPYKD